MIVTTILAASIGSQVLIPVIILGIMGLVFGIILAIAAKFFSVQTDPVWKRSPPSCPEPTAAAAVRQAAPVMLTRSCMTARR